MRRVSENIRKLGFKLLNQSNHTKKHYHLIGIAGIGMSGIARLLIARGDIVSGSDLVTNRLTDELTELGVQIHNGHRATFVEASDIIVRSSAIADDNPEIIAAKSTGKPIISRAKMLAMLMENFFRIAIAGSHGKTTTSSLAATLLIKSGLDPSYAIGGVLHEQETNAYLGHGEHIVVEADESDASFLDLQPDIAIITNIDSDHLSTYDNDIARLETAFLDFMHRVPDDGLIIVCVDDARLRALIQSAHCRVKTYSVEGYDADYQARDCNINNTCSEFIVAKRDGSTFPLTLAMPGIHNVSNALACVVLADALDIAQHDVAKTMHDFKGVGRRFDTYPLGEMTVVDDYGHHPREIEVTLKAARQNWPDRKICLVFQPHRYSRTQQLFDDFVRVLQVADKLILMDVYSANENYIESADSDTLAAAIDDSSAKQVVRLKGQDELILYGKTHFHGDEIVIFQGAGSIGAMVQPFLEKYHVVV